MATDEGRDQPERTTDGGRGGSRVTDLVALVLGAAVGSLHVRGSAGEALRAEMPGLFALVTLAVSLTATGPFLYLARCRGPRPQGDRCLWDGLWVVLGTPWLLTAPLRAVGPLAQAAALELYRPALVLGVLAASGTTLAIVWSRWVRISDRAGAIEDPWSWTTLVACVLVTAWPLQIGLSLILSAP